MPTDDHVWDTPQAGTSWRASLEEQLASTQAQLARANELSNAFQNEMRTAYASVSQLQERNAFLETELADVRTKFHRSQQASGRIFTLSR